MSNYKIFNIDKADELRIVYKKKQHYAKENLLIDLIGWQSIFGNTSIVGVRISLNHRYKKKTIVSVLDSLGYKLDSYKLAYDGVIPGKSTIFRFIPKDSETVES